jgi:hypothetical protein
MHSVRPIWGGSGEGDILPNEQSCWCNDNVHAQTYVCTDISLRGCYQSLTWIPAYQCHTTTP